MKVTLFNLSAEQLAEYVASEIEQYKNDKAAGNPYGTVRLADIQKYERAMQIAMFSEKGRIVHQECLDILAQEARLYETKERTLPKSMHDVHREFNGYGRYSR